MSWMWLYLAIVLEVAATVCMKLSNGCSRAIPSVLMVLFYAVSFFPTAMALRRLEVGTAYAVWSAVGTALITLIGMVLFKEQMSGAKIASLGVIIFGVVMLNLSGKVEQRVSRPTGADATTAPESNSLTRVLLTARSRALPGLPPLEPPLGCGFSIYNGVTRNRTTYDDNVATYSGAEPIVLPYKGKDAVDTPEVLYKTQFRDEAC